MISSSHDFDTRKYAFALLLLLFIGASLRFYGLDHESLWNDELSTWSVSNFQSLEDVMALGVLPDVHPPGYQVLIYLVEKNVGVSEFALRFPSAVAGIFSILAIYWLGTILYTRKEAIISSAFMALSWCPIYYSQEARSYSFVILFSIVTTSFWLMLQRAFDDNKSALSIKYLAAAYIITASLLSYTHYFGLFLVTLQGTGVILWGLAKGRYVNWLFIYFIIFLIYLPWVPHFIADLGGTPSWVPPPDWKTFPNYLKFCFSYSNTVFFVFSCVTLLHFISRIGVWIKTPQSSMAVNLVSPTAFLLMWLLIPFSFVFLKSSISSSIYLHRTMLISLPAVYLLFSRVIATWDFKYVKQRELALLCMLLVFTDNVFVNGYYTQHHKQQLRDGVAYILEQDNKIDHDSFVVGNAWGIDYLDYYFEKQSSKRVEALIESEADLPKLERILINSSNEYFWYIVFHKKPEKSLIGSLNDSYDQIDYREYKGVYIWLYRR